MNFDLFEMLAEKDVPPVPANFDREVHSRVNDSLLAMQVTEFVLQVVPYALLHFAQGLIGLIGFTLVGGFPHDSGDRRKHS